MNVLQLLTAQQENKEGPSEGSATLPLNQLQACDMSSRIFESALSMILLMSTRRCLWCGGGHCKPSRTCRFKTLQTHP